MVQATSFLLRWLFLCRLVDDRAEVQTWPYRPEGYFDGRHSQLPPPPPPSHPIDPTHAHQDDSPLHDDAIDIPTYRESIIRSLTSHPPGSTERLQKLDELRLQTVRDFARRLMYADEVIRYSVSRENSEKKEVLDQRVADEMPDVADDLDADDSIQRDIQVFMQRHHKNLNENNLWHRPKNIPDQTSNSLFRGKTPEQIQNTITSAQHLLSETRSFLPQLVSTVLHSPPALLPSNTADPISSLRSLLIRRCQIDPSLGIELCWLLEAEVGRKWKALFEHRQQTGKRLILIVQADIAQAIATIGAEKASAFNLLQDAEMATAFGMERSLESNGGGMTSGIPGSDSYVAGSAPRLPKAISDLRCRHFGDSMHFVDRLSQISLDLRHVPPVHRRAHLQERLRELNSRLCRRMATRGRISIDVENGHGEFGYHSSYHHHSHAMPQWSEDNIREDMIQHSVHFPMEPQSVRWPGGADESAGAGGGSSLLSDFERPQKRNGVVRALRILPDQCRVLDSRERCPFLVRMEVAETGLDANDARLYAVDVTGLGLTVEEVLGTTARDHNALMGNGAVPQSGFASYEIPPELMRPRKLKQQQSEEPLFPLSDDVRMYESLEEKAVPRGGYQRQDETYYDPPMYGDYNTYEMVRDQHYEQLHQEMRNDIHSPQYDAPMVASSHHLSVGSNLLDKVFGKPWKTECEIIRQQSPYRDVKGWRLASFIMKAGEDIRKEALVMQVSKICI